MKRAFKFHAVVLAILLLAAVQPVRADLVAVGAVDPVQGFPTFFQDIPGIQITGCNVVTVDPLNPLANGPPCGALALLDRAQPVVLANIEEMTFYRAEANLIAPTGERGRCRIEVQAGGPAPLVINGIIVRLTNLPVSLVDETYTVTTPFGVFDLILLAGETVIVEDFATNPALAPAIGAPPDFAGALVGPVQFFPSNGTGFTDPSGTFLGDSVTPGPLAFSPVTPVTAGAQLLFRVVGPGVDVTETGFTVEGKVFAQVAGTTLLTVDGASYSRTPASSVVTVFASSPSATSVTVTGVGVALPGEPVALTGGAGAFFARIPNVTTLPSSVSVTATGAAPLTPTILIQPLTDVVTITKAQFNTAAGTLTINAISSDQGTPAPTLTAGAFGQLTGGSLVVPLAAPPAQVTVTSSAGGTHTERVVIISETLSVTSAVFKRLTRRLIVLGTGSVPGNSVTIHLGGAAGPVVGTPRIVSALGTFAFGARPVALGGATTITAVSSGGATATFPITMR